MSTAYLGLGSNVDARKNIASGIAALHAKFGGVDLSPVYRTPAFGFDGVDFINLAARIETVMSPLDLKAFLHDLEDRHQRDRLAPKYSDRTLDIDILLYDDLYLHGPTLQIPREEILSAAHVLKPLSDLAPNLRHPVTRTTLSEIWKAFPQDQTKLKVIHL